MGGEDPPGTPRVSDQLQRFRDTHLGFPFQHIILNTPPSELIGTTPLNVNPTPLNAVMPETVTATLDDHEEVVFVVNNLPLTPVLSTPHTGNQEDDVDVMPLIPNPSALPSPPSRISPPAIITAIFVFKQPIISSTSSDTISVMSRVSRDPEGNSPTIIAAAAAVNRSSNLGLSTTPSIHYRELARSVAGSIERQVERQNQQIDAVIQDIRPNRPDPLIATKLSSVISGMTTPGMPQSSPSLLSSHLSLDHTLLTEWQRNLLHSDMKLLYKIPIKNQDEIIAYVDQYSSNQNVSGVGDVVAYAIELIEEYYSKEFTVPTIADITEKPKSLSSSDTTASNDL